MKITKFSHSCLLVEHEGKTVLFDPGEMSTSLLAGALPKKLDGLVITHEHADHFDKTFVMELLRKFPSLEVLTTTPVEHALDGADFRPYDGEGLFAEFDAPHEGQPPLLDPPTSIGVHFMDVLSHPGDSHSFTETMPILALPITAPWGATSDAVKLAVDLKPQFVVPIHDWQWKDQVRESMYQRLEGIFAQHDIMFISPEDGVSFAITL